MLDRTLSANVHTNEASILRFVYETSISISIAARLSLVGVSLLLRPSYIRIGDYSNIISQLSLIRHALTLAPHHDAIFFYKETTQHLPCDVLLTPMPR